MSVIRAEHGWHDGAVQGVLVDDHGTVRSDDGEMYECRHRRDYHVLG